MRFGASRNTSNSSWASAQTGSDWRCAARTGVDAHQTPQRPADRVPHGQKEADGRVRLLATGECFDVLEVAAASRVVGPHLPTEGELAAGRRAGDGVAQAGGTCLEREATLVVVEADRALEAALHGFTI